NSQLAIRTFRQELLNATTTADCWDILQEAARRFGFSGVRWRLSHTMYIKDLDDCAGEVAWDLRVPLVGFDYINFTSKPGVEPLPLNVNAFVDAVRTGLASERSVELTEVPMLASASR